MKYFVVIIIYKTAIENIVRETEAHRNYLKEGYNKGILLLSGPQVPRTGGVIIAKGRSQEEVEEYFSKDPYNLNSYADYKYIEFTPKSCRPEIKDWISS